MNFNKNGKEKQNFCDNSLSYEEENTSCAAHSVNQKDSVDETSIATLG